MLIKQKIKNKCLLILFKQKNKNKFLLMFIKQKIIKIDARWCSLKIKIDVN